MARVFAEAASHKRNWVSVGGRTALRVEEAFRSRQMAAKRWMDEFGLECALRPATASHRAEWVCIDERVVGEVGAPSLPPPATATGKAESSGARGGAIVAAPELPVSAGAPSP